MHEHPDPVLTRLEDYILDLCSTLGHADQHGPLKAYVRGLLLPGERKCMEPTEARLDPEHTSARHQSMHHFVAKAAWDERELLWTTC